MAQQHSHTTDAAHEQAGSIARDCELQLPSCQVRMQAAPSCEYSGCTITCRGFAGHTVEGVDSNTPQMRSLHKHWLVSFGYVNKGNQHAGCALMLQKKVFNKGMIRAVMQPSSDTIKGRAGIARITNGTKVDIVFVCTYVPPTTSKNAAKVGRAVYLWVEQQLRQLPRRCTVIHACDANVKLGVPLPQDCTGR